jgi:hypothetical protein
VKIKKIQVNSPEYRALVSSLLGREVKFENTPQIEIRKSPTVTKKAKKNHKYVIINTGYTSRLVKKFGADVKLIEKGKGKNNDVRMISNPQKHRKVFEKVVFIYDKLWGTGLYSAAPLEETVELLALLKNAKIDLNGSVVFRVKDLIEGDDLVFDLKDLDYCVMWTITDHSIDESASDSDDRPAEPYMKDETFKLGNKNFRLIEIDAESG